MTSLVPVENGTGDERGSLMSVESINPRPHTLTKLVKRLRALTLQLLPVEVDPQDLISPTSRIITPEVISAYKAAAGDFLEALPYCLLRARAEFKWDADHDPADYDENFGRAIACEVLARRIVHRTAPDRLNAVLATRYKHIQVDGDESDPTSALEMAIDSHCTIFLSSSEAQDIVRALWAGELIQKNNEHLDIDYVPYADTQSGGFWDHLDPSRLSVPRYQNIFRIVVWLLFLLVYSQAVRQPVERLQDPSYAGTLDEWEVALYVIGLSIFVEDMYKFFRLLQFVTWKAFTFWNVISLVTDSLLIAAFSIRMAGLTSTGDRSTNLRVVSFQVLSFVSPFIWMSRCPVKPAKLVTVFDGYKYVGMMQICVARMLRESGIFFALLSILALGFAQAMYALDAADGTTEAPSAVVHALVQALLQAPDFERYSTSPSGLLMYYLWNVVTAIILLNVLISLFSSAYEDVVDDAEAQYLAFFAGKTVGMIRAPDAYVYPAPFNLVEILFVSPFECWPLKLNHQSYAKLNRVVMSVIFFVPLTLIALFETSMKKQEGWVENWLQGDDRGDENYPQSRDPEVDEDNGLSISKVPFMELIKVFPNTSMSMDTLLLNEIRELREQLDTIKRKLDANDAR
ncbi:Calcium channel yvc1 [Marasmius crinis-equi]|uniref:Calcium channel yvc1 n=1 Tax=Marasmius crinis-equi TaxID=585013 RepID=A0ABR3FX21_9AGAR